MSIEEPGRIKNNQPDKDLALFVVFKWKKEEKWNQMRTCKMEDYLEVIYEIPTKRCVTTADISKYLNVSPPRVSRMVKKLNEK